MRDIAPSFQAKLKSGATTLCRCWLVERKDGRTLGFTDHDLDLHFDGHLFEASSGLDASAVESTTGLSVDNSHAVGVLSSAGLSETDIKAGLYDNAAVHIWLVDWTDVSSRLLQFRGALGEIEHGESRFEVELRGLAEALNRTVGRSFVPECDRILGDAKCGVDLSTPGYTAITSVDSVRDNRAIRANGVSDFESDWFAFGTLEWLTGANKGVLAKIKFDTISSTTRQLETWEEAPNEIVVGDQFKLYVGCDKSAGTCRSKFSNILNFRGFPQMPGEDWVAAYPAADKVHDGGSLKNG